MYPHYKVSTSLTQNGRRSNAGRDIATSQGGKTDRKAEQHGKEWKRRRDVKLPRRLGFC